MMKKWHEFSYKSLRKIVSHLQEKRAEKESEILIIMQISRCFPTAMRDIEEIFKANKHLKLHRYKPFRAWYKKHKEWESRDPDFYARLLEADMTPHEEDPYFDPDAPDWELYELPHYYDYYDDEEDEKDDDDDFLDDNKNKKDSPSDWIYRGIGFGLVNSVFNGSGNSGSN